MTLHRHPWQQVSVQVRPTTFPGNATGPLVVTVLTGDWCPKCNAIRTPTKLDNIRWPVVGS